MVAVKEARRFVRYRHLGVILFPVLVFTVPKLFGFYLPQDMHSTGQRWLFIVLTDILPWIAISGFILRYSGNPAIHTKSGGRGEDPLLTLRFAACLLVLFGHYFGVVFLIPGSGAMARHPALRLLMSSPWAGVWLFFALSGYLMGKGFFSGRYGLDNEGIARFVANRALRIFPVYVAAVLLIGVMTAPAIFEPRNLWMLAQTFALDYNGSLPINVIGALWSVSTEFQFYLLAPFLALLVNAIDGRFRLRYVSILSVILAGVLLNCFIAHKLSMAGTLKTGGFYKSIYTPLGSNLYLFVSGMLLAKLIQRDKPARMERNLLWGLLVLGALCLVLTIAASFTFYAKYHAGAYLLFGPVFALIGALIVIFLFETATLAGAPLVIVRWTQFGGTLTYCLYVLHPPILDAVRDLAPGVIHFRDQLLYAPLFGGGVLVASYVFYRFIEKPCAALRR
jgi:peptidoglycan/LPS O-acetylase OafA/YrhL